MYLTGLFILFLTFVTYSIDICGLFTPFSVNSLQSISLSFNQFYLCSFFISQPWLDLSLTTLNISTHLNSFSSYLVFPSIVETSDSSAWGQLPIQEELGNQGLLLGLLLTGSTSVKDDDIISNLGCHGAVTGCPFVAGSEKRANL